MLERYLRYAIAPGASPVQSAHLVHGGFLRTKPNGRWYPVEGEETFELLKPGFIWDGVIRPFPLVKIEAHDTLLNGRGRMVVKLNSLIPLAKAEGPKVDQSAAARWLMEGVWFPSMFASDLVQWEQVDRLRARVSIRQAGPPVAAEMTFDEAGRITTIEADRYRDVGRGKAVMTRWKAVCCDYARFGSFQAPTSVRGAWMLPKGDFDCIDFKVRSIEYS